jgi:SagB-type dehydrogenase family enzyme
VKLRETRLRRAVTLAIYWQKNELVIENYLSGNRVAAAPLTVSVLDFFSRWRMPSEFYRRFATYERTSLALTLRQLQERHFLLPKNSAEARLDERIQETWSPWLPAAGMLQFGTRSIQYESNLALVRRRYLKRAKETPPPPPVKHYPRSPQVALPSPRKESAFTSILLARRTWRRFSKRRIRLDDLATLLGLTWGVQRWVNFPGIGRVALKTSPSAGARHPIEVYVLAVNVEGLPRGIYHYAADNHRLELLKRNSSSRDIVNFLGNQWWYAPAAALMLMTAVFPRTQWKYPDAAAYRTVMIDAGHVCQTFCLVATWLGLAPFCTMAFDQALVEKELAIDGVSESVVYAAGVGSPPTGAADWAPWPHPSRWAGITTS